MKPKTKKQITRIISLLLATILLGSIVVLPASAATAWPSLSSSAYAEFTATKQINCYRNTACTTRGTCSPAKSYNSYIAPGDVCRIEKATSTYFIVKFPTSSGYKTAYIRRADLVGVSSPVEKVTSQGKATTFKNTNGATYGNTAKSDAVFDLGTNGSYKLILYSAKSGSRQYKLGYVKTSDYNNIIKGKKTTSQNTSASGWQWPMSGYRTSQAFNNKRSNNSRPYHTGIDMVSSNKTVVAAASGTVLYKGYSSGNGYHVVLSHSNGTKTLYSHLANYNSCPAVGKSISKGSALGIMGNTGNSTGAHLHFAIYKGASNDPWGYATSSGSNKISYSGCTFYNPSYVINNGGKLP